MFKSQPTTLSVSPRYHGEYFWMKAPGITCGLADRGTARSGAVEDSDPATPGMKSHFGDARSSHRVKRRGFTLIEVLLSLGLTVVLMLALYTVFDLYQQVTIAGRADVERAQIVRAIVRKLELDLRSCVFQPTQEGASAGPAEEEATEETVTEEEMSTEAAMASNVSGIVGDATSIVISTSRPLRGLDYTPFLAGELIGSRTSDLRSVSYFLADPSAEGLQGTVGQLVEDQYERTSDGIQGFARLEGDRLAMQLADEQSDLQVMAENTQILAAEINYLQFRYFDGLEWLETWDSGTTGSLPQAVEIVIGFRPAQTAATTTQISDTFLSVDLHRYVVPLTLSDEAVLVQQEF